MTGAALLPGRSRGQRQGSAAIQWAGREAAIQNKSAGSGAANPARSEAAMRRIRVSLGYSPSNRSSIARAAAWPKAAYCIITMLSVTARP